MKHFQTICFALACLLVIVGCVLMYVLFKHQQHHPAPVENLHSDEIEETGREYFSVDIERFSRVGSFHTHVEIVGTVRLVRHERDGDLHVRLCEHGACVVAECIPKLPCPRPRLRQRIVVRGISRFDGEHKWYEVHPVEEWQITSSQ